MFSLIASVYLWPFFFFFKFFYKGRHPEKNPLPLGHFLKGGGSNLNPKVLSYFLGLSFGHFQKRRGGEPILKVLG